MQYVIQILQGLFLYGWGFLNRRQKAKAKTKQNKQTNKQKAMRHKENIAKRGRITKSLKIP